MGALTPGPSSYENINHGYHKRRASAAVICKGQSPRLQPIKRNEATDFYETEQASIRTKAKSPSASFLKSKKKSFVQMKAEKNKVPGAGTY